MSTRNVLKNRFLNYVSNHGLLFENDKVLVAYSGGLDSSVLLHVLNTIMESMRLSLIVGYFNHDLRGDESKQEATFVQEVCDSYGLQLETGTGDVLHCAKEYKISIQEAARKLRYMFFEKSAEHHDVSKIATAHHGDDQTETVLMRFFQGGSIASLRGIPKKRDKYIRPLLWATRYDLEMYVQNNRIDYFADSSNNKEDYLRNKIRLNILPYLREQLPYNIDLVLEKHGQKFQQAAALANVLKRESYAAVLVSEKKDKIILDIASFKNYFSLIQQLIIQECFDRLGFYNESINEKHAKTVVEFIYDTRGKNSLNLNNEIILTISKTSLVLGYLSRTSFDFPIEYGMRYELPWEGHVFQSEIIDVSCKGIDYSTIRNEKSEWNELVDRHKINEPLRLRTWQAGDAFCPLGMDGTKKLSDFFVDLKIPLHLKNKYPVLADCEKIIWVCGLRIDDRVKITSKTEDIIGLHLYVS